MVNKIKKIVLSNFFKGIPPKSFKSGYWDNGYDGKDGWISYNSLGINPFLHRLRGFLAPATQPNEILISSSHISGTPVGKAFRNNGNGEMWFVTTTGKIYKATPSVLGGPFDTLTLVHTITPSSGSLGNVYDCIIANVNGTAYLFYSWDKGEATNPTRFVGIYDFTSSYTTANAAADEWKSASSASFDIPTWMPIELGSDRNVYIGSGYVLDRITTNVAIASSYTPDVFEVPKDYQITTIRALQVYMMVGIQPRQSPLTGVIYANGKCGVFFWNFADPFNPTDVAWLDDFKISNIVNNSGDVYAFTGNKNNINTLRGYDGNNFKQLANFGGSLPNHNASDTYNEMVIWADGANILTYGSPDIGIPPALHCIDTPGTSPTFITIPQAALANNPEYYMGGASYIGYSQGNYSTSFRWITTFINLPYGSTIRKVTAFFIPIASSNVPEISLFYAINNDRSNSTAIGKIGNLNATTPKDIGGLAKKSFPVTVPNIYNFSLIINGLNGSSYPDAVLINRIEIEYEITNIF